MNQEPLRPGTMTASEAIMRKKLHFMSLKLKTCSDGMLKDVADIGTILGEKPVDTPIKDSLAFKNQMIEALREQVEAKNNVVEALRNLVSEHEKERKRKDELLAKVTQSSREWRDKFTVQKHEIEAYKLELTQKQEHIERERYEKNRLRGIADMSVKYKALEQTISEINELTKEARSMK